MVPRCSGPITGASGSRSCKRREDLDPLDRVDPQVGVELHRRLEHLGRIARLLRHHLHQHRVDGRGPRHDGRRAGGGDRERDRGGLGDRRDDRGGSEPRPAEEPGPDAWRPARARAPGPAGRSRRAGRRGLERRRGGGARPRVGEGQPLLMLEQRLEHLLRPVLAFEELPVEVGRLLADPLEGDQVFLGDSERLDQGRGERTGARARGRSRRRRAWPFVVAEAGSRAGSGCRAGSGWVWASSWATVPGALGLGWPGSAAFGGRWRGLGAAAASGRSWPRRP